MRERPTPISGNSRIRAARSQVRVFCVPVNSGVRPPKPYLESNRAVHRGFQRAVIRQALAFYGSLALPINDAVSRVSPQRGNGAALFDVNVRNDLRRRYLGEAFYVGDPICDWMRAHLFTNVFFGSPLDFAERKLVRRVDFHIATDCDPIRFHDAHSLPLLIQ